MNTRNQNRSLYALQTRGLVGIVVYRIVRLFRSVMSHRQILKELESANYAMKKHSPEQCEREIEHSDKLLRRVGSLPNV